MAYLDEVYSGINSLDSFYKKRLNILEKCPKCNSNKSFSSDNGFSKKCLNCDDKKNNSSVKQYPYNENGICKDKSCTNYNPVQSHYCDNCVERCLNRYGRQTCRVNCKFHVNNEHSKGGHGICADCLNKLKEVNKPYIITPEIEKIISEKVKYRI